MKSDFFTREKEKQELSSIKEITEPLTKDFIETEFKGQESLTEPIKQDFEEKLPVIEKTKITKPTRVPTGIHGLDELLEGGFIPNSTILISGEAGAGKTIFCTQFIWNALCLGENGVYITLQQPPDEIRNDVIQFSRDFEVAEKNGQCRIVYVEPYDVKKLVNTILKNVKEINAKRLVIDSITLIGGHEQDIRKNLDYLVRELKKLGVTTLMTSEIEEGSNKVSRFGVEEFIVDGVIVLQYMKYAAGGVPRSLFIKKMRRTKHGTDIYPFEITDKGIVVKKV